MRFAFDVSGITRRDVLRVSAAAALTAFCGAAAAPKRLLLRSSWQTVNIGDIAHTPGMLKLLEQYLPAVEVTLWPNALSDDVERMLRTRFPKLRIAKTDSERKQAIEECNACLHGSGPGLVGWRELDRWRETGKPYAFGGVTLNDAELKDRRELLAGAKFVFCRDSKSLEALEASGISGPAMGWGPDATFLLDLRDDKKAASVLTEHGLTPRQFLCAVPRLRYTPYWEIHKDRKYSDEEKAMKTEVNERHREADHAKLREAIAAWVRETKQRVLLCPEMTYQVDLLGPLLFDPLPEDVKPHVANLGRYWLTGEAASVYSQAAAVISFEMHSPIIAAATGTPAIHLRQPTDTRKGQMWRDVGLDDWLFEIDDSEGPAIAAKLLELHRNMNETTKTLAEARSYVRQRGEAMMTATGAMLA
ncbi:MAG: polysaccharide pyruvyl transferase family protein [Planctomycetaceae bacterium]|nr:polysaccharide pyruvyl transferase family protein [Planctomycetaceae bacterium]